MSGTVLNAQERNEKGPKARRDGFVPGIIYGAGQKTSTSVMFKADELEMYLKKLKGTKVQIKLGDNTETGFIKEMQRDPVKSKIIHIDIQVAGQNDLIRMKLPVKFEGAHKVEAQGLIIDEYLSHVTVYGKEKDIPESITIDISDKKAGDVINVSMLTVGEGLKITDDPSEVIATISEPQREVVEEEPAAETAPEQAEVKAE